MPFWDDTFLSTCTKKSQSSTDSDGDPGGYGSAVTFKARVQRSKDRDATEIEHTAVIYTSTEVLVTDRVWLPGDSTSDVDLARRPAAVYRTADLDDPEAVLFKVLL